MMTDFDVSPTPMNAVDIIVRIVVAAVVSSPSIVIVFLWICR